VITCLLGGFREKERSNNWKRVERGEEKRKGKQQQGETGRSMKKRGWKNFGCG